MTREEAERLVEELVNEASSVAREWERVGLSDDVELDRLRKLVVHAMVDD